MYKNMNAESAAVVARPVCLTVTYYASWLLPSTFDAWKPTALQTPEPDHLFLWSWQAKELEELAAAQQNSLEEAEERHRDMQQAHDKLHHAALAAKAQLVTAQAQVSTMSHVSCLVGSLCAGRY